MKLLIVFSVVYRTTLNPSYREPHIICWESTDLPESDSPSISVMDPIGTPPPSFLSISEFPVETTFPLLASRVAIDYLENGAATVTPLGVPMVTRFAVLVGISGVIFSLMIIPSFGLKMFGS